MVRGFLPLTGVTLLSACALAVDDGEVGSDFDSNPPSGAQSSELVTGEALKPSGHYLVGAASSAPTFPIADTAWLLLDAKREDVTYYLDKRKAQGFNTVLVTFNRHNAYGDKAWNNGTNGKPDVTKPATTPGSSFASAAEYDYWDHVLWVLGELKTRKLNAVMNFEASEGISGAYDGNQSGVYITTTAQAYTYGQYVGSRLKAFAPYVVFSVLDDRSPVSPSDKRAHYRALAEGIADGVNGVNSFNNSANYATTLMTAMPRKSLSSSSWFHADAWLDVNSIQAWPAEGRSRVAEDFAKTPTKPTWVMETRYENYNSTWTAWSQRYQAYIPTFAGAFGASYGEEAVCVFSTGWKNRLSAPGAPQIPYLGKLMAEWTNGEYLGRVPDQSLVVTAGTLNNTTVGGDFQVATRSSDRKMAMVYAMNGRTIALAMSQLVTGSMRAFWFNPRTGKWSKNGTEYSSRTDSVAFATVASGSGAANVTFDPPASPAAANDWVLVLDQVGSTTDTVVDFESLSHGTVLTNYGGIKWGSANGGWQVWDGGASETKTGYVNSTSKSEVAGTFTLPSGKVLKSIKITTSCAPTIKISSAGNPERVYTSFSSKVKALGWTTASPVVTVKVTCASQWGASEPAFDDITY